MKIKKRSLFAIFLFVVSGLLYFLSFKIKQQQTLNLNLLKALTVSNLKQLRPEIEADQPIIISKNSKPSTNNKEPPVSDLPVTQDNVANKKEKISDVLDRMKHLPVIYNCEFFDGQSRISSYFEKQINLITFSEKDFDTNSSLLRIFKINKLASDVAIFKFMFSLPTQRRLIETIDDKGIHLLGDIHYAYLIYEAKKELQDSINQAELIQLRAYLVHNLTKLFFILPNNFANSELIEICRMLSDVSNLEQDPSILRTSVVQAFSKFNLKPSDLDFDPNYKPNLDIVWGDTGFQYYNKSKYK